MQLPKVTKSQLEKQLKALKKENMELKSKVDDIGETVNEAVKEETKLLLMILDEFLKSRFSCLNLP